ncbi:MAG: methyltransferase domain-containing protein [Gammaproteobacteria bacterium]|nr:methyltransferase domain-containing protein [Gammaproteobacteria bacterium]
MAESQPSLGESAINREHQVAPRELVERRSGPVTAMDRWLSRKILEMAGDPPINVRLWDGNEISTHETVLHRLVVADRQALWQLVYDPEFNFGELYATNRVSLEGDLVTFLEAAYQGISGTDKSPLHKFIQVVQHRPRLNTLRGSRENIHHHYNIGNPFYELWLDREAMQYTCAYFPEPSMTIEQAQVAKLHHVARKLQLKPGQTVVEAGCGWGGLARFFAKHYGVKVKAYNISHQQVIFAREKAEEQGLSDLVEYVEDDYRNIVGTYDVFVSVGMLEHVGRQQYTVLGDVIKRSLRPNGFGLVHSIGRNRPGLMNSWIEKRIFPGAYPPSLKEMMDIFEPNNLSVLDVENIRLHYAKTLEHWLMRFAENEDTIRGMFDDNFVRAWRLYLAGSIAAFTTGELQLFQVLISPDMNNELPWSREYMYPQGQHP